MASPQCENGYTKIANELMEALIRTRIPGEQMKVVFYIIRYSYGWDKKTCTATHSEISKKTDMHRAAVQRAVQNLYMKRIIDVCHKAQGPKQKSEYKLNKNYEEWMMMRKRHSTRPKQIPLKDICYLCGFDKVLNTHHIIPKSEGGSNDNKNKINLCPNCHALVHKGEYKTELLVNKKVTIESIDVNKNSDNETVFGSDYISVAEESIDVNKNVDNKTDNKNVFGSVDVNKNVYNETDNKNVFGSVYTSVADNDVVPIILKKVYKERKKPVNKKVTIESIPKKRPKQAKKFIPPTVHEVVNYFLENNFSAALGKRAFNYYDAANWHDGNGKKIKNWKQKMHGVWFKDENRVKKPETFGTPGGLL